MKKRVLVLDIDGTLTNSNKEITKATRDALFAMQEAGGTLVIASGRPTKGTAKIAEECGLRKFPGYVISYNGARIVRFKTGEILYNNHLPKQFLPQLYDFALKHDIGLITYDPKDNAVTGTRSDQYMELEIRINGLEKKETKNFLEEVDFPINKCLFSGDKEVLRPLTEELQKRYYGVLNVYRSEPFFLEVMPPQVDKAHALCRLLPSLGYSREDCVCCGDGYNDITMIQYAGVGVAMANAQPEVLAAADIVTLSNDEDGLVPIIEKYF